MNSSVVGVQPMALNAGISSATESSTRSSTKHSSQGSYSWVRTRMTRVERRTGTSVRNGRIDQLWTHADQVNRWAYGILNGFPPWEQAKEPPENALLKVACMNVKKTGGAGTAVADDIRHHAEQYQELIREQVEIIDPDIIIGGLRGMWVWKVLFPDLSATVEVEGVEVFRWRRAKVIDFYHPSNYYPRSMSYALLSRIFSNQKLKQL
ncbi:MAG: hypothetical protein H6590_08695 [Flavobacteriales bacterium]|nr:hypothetical protein [Flavobacteriales bacterium]